MKRPLPDEYGSFYKGYIDKVSGNHIVDSLISGFDQVKPILDDLTDDQWNFRYESDKWSVKELWLHVIDTERIMAYRALRIARGDTTSIPGFDQNAYVPLSGAENRSGESLVGEYEAVRQSTLELFRHLGDEALDRRGIASGNPFSVRALGFIIVGHERHHLQILKDKYL